MREARVRERGPAQVSLALDGWSLVEPPQDGGRWADRGPGVRAGTKALELKYRRTQCQEHLSRGGQSGESRGCYPF